MKELKAFGNSIDGHNESLELKNTQGKGFKTSSSELIKVIVEMLVSNLENNIIHISQEILEM